MFARELVEGDQALPLMPQTLHHFRGQLAGTPVKLCPQLLEFERSQFAPTPRHRFGGQSHLAVPLPALPPLPHRAPRGFAPGAPPPASSSPAATGPPPGVAFVLMS